MGDRERGAVLIGLALVMLVVVVPDLDRLGSSGRVGVELALVAIGLIVGVVLIVAGRSR